MRAMMDDLGLSAETVGSSSIFTGDEEVFAFARAVVRCTLLATRLDSLQDGMLTLLRCPPLPHLSVLRSRIVTPARSLVRRSLESPR